MILECFASVDEDDRNLLVILCVSSTILENVDLLQFKGMRAAKGLELVLDRVAQAASGFRVQDNSTHRGNEGF
jgi:hypothetical protein